MLSFSSPRLRIFLWISTSATDAVADNPYSIKTCLANSSSIFFINRKIYKPTEILVITVQEAYRKIS